MNTGAGPADIKSLLARDTRNLGPCILLNLSKNPNLSAVTLIPKSDLFIVVKTTTLLFQLNYCEHPSILFAKQKQKPNFLFLDHMYALCDANFYE